MKTRKSTSRKPEAEKIHKKYLFINLDNSGLNKKAKLSLNHLRDTQNYTILYAYLISRKIQPHYKREVVTVNTPRKKPKKYRGIAKSALEDITGQDKYMCVCGRQASAENFRLALADGRIRLP